MKTILKYFGEDGLKGGLNVTDNPIIVPPNQMVIAKNVQVSRTIARKKRGGLELYNTSEEVAPDYPNVVTTPTSGSAIRKITQYFTYLNPAGEPVEYLFLHQGTKVWSIETRTSVAVDRTGALTIDTDSIPSYQVFEGKLYFADSEQSYNKWDGTAASPGDAVAATSPADGPGKYLRAHQGRMWMAGNQDFPFRLYYSTALDGDDWTTNGGSLDFTWDGDPEGITAIFPPFQGKLYVATRRAIYEIQGSTPADFVIRPVTNGIGCNSHNSAVATPNDIIFASDRGIHSLYRVQVSDQSESKFLSRDIQTLWTQLLNRQAMNKTQAVWDDVTNSYVMVAPGSGQSINNVTLVYNIEFGIWTTWEGIDSRSVDKVLVGGLQYVLCGREDGQIGFVNDNKEWDFDDTNGFAFQFKTGKIYPGSEIDTQFRVHSVTVLMSTTRLSTITVGWDMDSVDQQQSGSKSISLGQSQDLLGSTFILGQSELGFGQFNSQKVSVDLSGYNFQLEIIASGTSDVTFYGYILEVSSEESHNV